MSELGKALEGVHGLILVEGAQALLGDISFTDGDDYVVVTGHTVGGSFENNYVVPLSAISYVRIDPKPTGDEGRME